MSSAGLGPDTVVGVNFRVARPAAASARVLGAGPIDLREQRLVRAGARRRHLLAGRGPNALRTFATENDDGRAHTLSSATSARFRTSSGTTTFTARSLSARDLADEQRLLQREALADQPDGPRLGRRLRPRRLLESGCLDDRAGPGARLLRPRAARLRAADAEGRQDRSKRSASIREPATTGRRRRRSSPGTQHRSSPGTHTAQPGYPTPQRRPRTRAAATACDRAAGVSAGTDWQAPDAPGSRHRMRRDKRVRVRNARRTVAEPDRWVLCLEYRECRTEPVKLSPSCEPKGGAASTTAFETTFELRVRRWKDACPEDHADHECALQGLRSRDVAPQGAGPRSLKCPACEDCECVVLAVGTIETRPGQPSRRRGSTTTTGSTGASSTRIRRWLPLIRCFHGGLAHIETINWTPGSHYAADEFLDRLRRDRLKVTFDQPMKPQARSPTREAAG